MRNSILHLESRWRALRGIHEHIQIGCPVNERNNSKWREIGGNQQSLLICTSVFLTSTRLLKIPAGIMDLFGSKASRWTSIDTLNLPHRSSQTTIKESTFRRCSKWSQCLGVKKKCNMHAYWGIWAWEWNESLHSTIMFGWLVRIEWIFNVVCRYSIL